MRAILSRFFNNIWYGNSWQCVLLLPVAWVFSQLVKLRRLAYQQGWLSSESFSIPIIVVGNISVGGSGKTPLVIWLIELLKKVGYKPAIISRGYKGKAGQWPQQVRIDSDPVVVGDEAVQLARRCQCPIAVGPDRGAAIKALLEHTDCNVIVSDDGLQHYAMQRDIEIAVVDGIRRYGNQRLLPAGPLREPISRLQQVDFIVSNGIAGRGEYAMQVKGLVARNLVSDKLQGLERFTGQTVHAVCGIGNPQRFFTGLKKFGINLIEHVYPDHHPYLEKDITFDDDLPVLMTEKDAVKCQRFKSTRHWFIPVQAELNKHFAPRLLALLEKRKDNG